MKYKAVIFDLDGVLCETDKYHYEAWKEIADELDIPFNEEMNNRLRGVSREKSLEIILKNYRGVLTPGEKKKYLDMKNRRYRELLENLSASNLDDEVKRTMDELRRLGVKLAVGSSSKNAVLILSRLGLSDYFDAVCDGNEISHSKPNPEVFLKAAGYLSMDPVDCLVVEDAKAGIMAAKAGGMAGAAVGDAKNDGMADYDLGSFSELIDIVCG